MERRIFSMTFFICIFFIDAYGDNFWASNADGIDFYFQRVNDSVARYAVHPDSSDSLYYEIDTLRLPDTIWYEGSRFIVDPGTSLINIISFTYAVPSVVILPKNFGNVNNEQYLYPILFLTGTKEQYDEEADLYYTPQSVHTIIVDDANPNLSSIDGVLYNKTADTLLAFPPGRRGTYTVPESVWRLEMACFMFSEIDTLNISDELNDIGDRALFYAQRIRSFRYPNALKRVEEGHIVLGTALEEIIFGSGLEFIGGSNFGTGNNKLQRIKCLAVSPPETTIEQFQVSDFVSLFVPRKSIEAYRLANGWKGFHSILPIEPPVIVGMDTAEIAWVSNAVATSYTLTLYTDEARTQRFMSLTFDTNGHLTHIDINSGHMPARMSALYSEEGETEKRFAEYYSFTISGLSPETRYYYTRQSLNGTEVIDEETGSFETQSDGEEGLEQNSGNSSKPQKMIKDGQVLIRSGNATYNLEGTSIRK